MNSSVCSLSAAGFDLSEPMAVLNMGAAFTDFHILYDENIALTRSIPMGGAMLTQAIVVLEGSSAA